MGRVASEAKKGTNLFMSGGRLTDEGEAELKVGNSRPSGEDSGENGGVKRREGNPFQHDPAEGDHLSNGADFARPVGFDFNAGLVVVENPEAADDDDVAGDDEDNEPRRQSPAFWSPRKDGKGGEGEEEEALIRQRIEKGPELRKLIEFASKVAIESVGDGGDDEDGHR